MWGTGRGTPRPPGHCPLKTFSGLTSAPGKVAVALVSVPSHNEHFACFPKVPPVSPWQLQTAPALGEEVPSLRKVRQSHFIFAKR